MNAVEVLRLGGYSCVVEKDGVIVDALLGIGVKPLIALYERHPKDLSGAMLADKVIGRAAAMLAVGMGAAEVYGQIMSQSAKAFLDAKGVRAGCGEMVSFIENRTHDGVCPIEASVLEVDDPGEAYHKIKATIAGLMAKK